MPKGKTPYQIEQAYQREQARNEERRKTRPSRAKKGRVKGDHKWTNRGLFGLLSPLILVTVIFGSELPDQEVKAIILAVERNVPDEGLRKNFVKLLKAIRKAENGGPGREFGILSQSANTFDKQAGWCAQKCWAEYRYWSRFESDRIDYITYLGSQYAPIGADNDPKSLNLNWVKNVKQFMEAKE